MQTGTDILLPQPATGELLPAPANDALTLLLADSRSEETRRAYRNDLRDFFAFYTQTEATPAAVANLCSLEAGALALALNGYKGAMRDRGLSEATVNRRLAAVRALLRMARRLGAACPDPAGLVTSEKVRPYRDTRGPALDAARKLLAAPDRNTLRGKRDYALLLFLCENALRRGELTRCDVADFEPESRRLRILGKGHGTQKEPVTISEPAAIALQAYLDARRSAALLTPSDPLFTNVARFSDGAQRLTGRGLLHIVNTYGLQVLGAPLHPHALRHFAITAVLDATGGDVRTAQRLSRHASLLTLQKYDDNRSDLQGNATNLLSALLTAGPKAG